MFYGDIFVLMAFHGAHDALYASFENSLENAVHWEFYFSR